MKPGFLRALPILGLLLTPSLAAQDTTAYRVASMRVFLFHETTGTIDTIDLVAPRDRGELFNTNIGEGLAHGSPSGAVVVFVQLTGPFHVDETGHLSPPFALDTTRSLRLNAQIDGRTVLERAVRLRSLFSEEHQVWVPFLLYGTGCGELKLTATIIRNREPEATLDRSIFFRCGE